MHATSVVGAAEQDCQNSTARRQAVRSACRTYVFEASLRLFPCRSTADLSPWTTFPTGLTSSAWARPIGRATPSACDEYSAMTIHTMTTTRLGIMAPIPAALASTCDFVISSDVLEHVAPPYERALSNLLRLLKPGGLLVLTVPLKPEARQTSTSLRAHRGSD